MTSFPRSTSFLILFVAVLFSGPGRAEPDAWAACIACHGDRGQGNEALHAPALAGQHEWYTARELEQFASGLRGSHSQDGTGQQMRPFAQSLDQDQRSAVARFLADLEPVSQKGSLEGNMMNGSRYYQARCGSCHGPEAEGNEAFQAPRLQGLPASYLERQMRYFQEGIRGHSDDDRYGRQMALMARTISDEEWRDVLYYITEQH